MHYHIPTLHPLPPTHIFPTPFSSTPQQIIPIASCIINLHFVQERKGKTDALAAILSKRNHQEQQKEVLAQLTIGSMDSHKNPILGTTHNTHNHILPSPSSSSQDFKTTHYQQHTDHSLNKNIEVDQGFIDTLKDGPSESVYCSSLAENVTIPPPPREMEVVEESGRDRLKRHRVEMAGRVWIPDIWGHEDLLKDWIDCTVFDSSLGNKTIMSARESLVQERRSTLRIENRC